MTRAQRSRTTDRVVTAEGLAELPVRDLVRLVLWLHDENERLKAGTIDVVIGCCDPDRLCDLHRAAQFDCLRGTAMTRGEVHAERVLRDSTAAAALVVDLTGDPELRVMIEAEVRRGVAKAR